MLIFRLIIVSIALVATLPGISTADVVVWTSGDYEIGSGKEWFQILELQTYNDVTVTMPGGGGVGYFKMYDNSELTSAGGVLYLYLYENATASFFSGANPMELYIDPASTGLVKLYADFDRFEPYGPYGEGHVYGNWLSNDAPFSIKLVGHGAYSHIQFIPEPTTIAILALGGLAIRRNRRQ